MDYGMLQLVHLLAAIGFVGALLYQALILERVKRSLSPAALAEVEQVLGPRARRVLHVMVVFLYGAGIGLAWHYRPLLVAPLDSRFGLLLSLKILLAAGVFVSFGLVAVLLRRKRMNAVRYRVLQRFILAQALGIVVLAKAMFFLPG